MKNQWDLSSLYTSFDDPMIHTDITKIQMDMADLNSFYATLSTDSQETTEESLLHILDKLTSVTFLSAKMTAYSKLQSSVDITNSHASKLATTIESYTPSIKKLTVGFQNYLTRCQNLWAVVDQSEALKAHSFYLQELISIKEHSLDQTNEEIIALMQNTGSGSWNKLHNELLSTLQVEVPEHLAVNGERLLPITVVRNLASSSDMQIRKEAYLCEKQAYSTIALPMAAAINGIKGEAITLAQLRHFQDPLAMTLFDSRMDQPILDSLIQSMEDFLPLIREFLTKKARLLGHDKGLPMYDLLAPLARSQKRFTYDEAKLFILKHFETYSSELADFARHAFDHDWIDVEPRAGKKGGAFCYNLCNGESRILLNFDGSIGSLITLAHELGHGFHGKCLKEEHFLNRTYTMPIAETASTFCECIAIKGALQSLGADEEFAILDSQVRRYVAIIMDIYSRYLFENRLFEHRKESPVSADKLCNLMAEAQQDAYGTAIDHVYNLPYAWVNKCHYYYIDRNFYNFPYAFGLLFAKGLYRIYETTGHNFLEDYNTLLATTGKASIQDLGKQMNLELSDKIFYKTGLESIAEDIQKLMSMMDERIDCL